MIIVGVLIIAILGGGFYIVKQTDYKNNKCYIDILHNQMRLGKNLKETDTGHVGEVIDKLIDNAKWTQSNITDNKHFVKAVGTYDKGHAVEADIYLTDQDIKNGYLSGLSEYVVYEDGKKINTGWAIYTLVRNYNASKGISLPSAYHDKDIIQMIKYSNMFGIDYTKLDAFDKILDKLETMKNIESDDQSTQSTDNESQQSQPQSQKTYKIQTYAPFYRKVGQYDDSGVKYTAFKQSTLVGAPSTIQDFDQYLSKFSISMEEDNIIVVSGMYKNSNYRITFYPDYNTNKLNIHSITIDEEQVPNDLIQSTINKLYGYSN